MSEAAALVLFSGGQDSTVCLAWALERYERVETIGFDYGQRHAIELEQRHVVLRTVRAQFPHWGERLGDDHIVEMTELGALSETALTRDAEIEMTAAGLPSTFVPGRNLLFFTYAAAVGYRRSIPTLVGGMCETDYSGYPDCRDETIKALEKSISLGMDREFAIATPLMWIDKGDTWAMAAALGGEKLVEIIVGHTHTCYLGDRSTRHDWGYGCGVCPACELRAKGWHKRQRDKAVVRAE
jgi:7-cyano-7-deazaguanine synthase